MLMAGPLGVLVEVRQQPPSKMKKTSMAAPWGVLSIFLATATTKVEDVDGGAPRGCCRYFQQRPPPKMKTSMAAPLTSIAICSEFCKKDVGSDKWPRGVLAKSSHYLR
jgi:hypothetical protein